MSEDEKVTNPAINSDKPVVKLAVLASHHEDFSPEWVNACRQLLKKYFELRQSQTTKKYSLEKLCDEILELHHTRNKFGSIVVKESGLTRQDLWQYLNANTEPTAPKFRFIDYFIITKEVWKSEFFQATRKSIINDLHAVEINNLEKIINPKPWTSTTVKSENFLFSPKTHYCWNGRYWGVTRGWKEDFKVSVNVTRWPTHILSYRLDESRSYIKVLFPKFSKGNFYFFGQGNELVKRTDDPLDVDGFLKDAIVLHGYIFHDSKYDFDHNGLHWVGFLSNIVLYSRGLSMNTPNPYVLPTDGMFPRISFSSSSDAAPIDPEGNSHNRGYLKILFDANRFSLYGANHTDYNISPFPRLNYITRTMDVDDELYIRARVKKYQRSPSPHRAGEVYLFPRQDDVKIFKFLEKVEDIGLIC